MKIPATILFVFAAISLILMGSVSLGNVYALKDEDGRFIILTLENVKSRDIEAYSIHI